MAGFRVLVNLSHYFSDYRRVSWVYVDSVRFKTLSDLKKHISEVFSINGDFEVFVSDIYIPSKEDIGVINEKDVLELRETDCDSGVTVTPKHVFEIPVPAEGSEKKKKRKKSCSQVETDQSTDFVDSLAGNFHPEYNSSVMKKRKKAHGSASSEEFLDSSIGDCTKKVKKKSKRAKESEYSSSVPIVSEEFESNGTVSMNMECENKSVRNCLETCANDLQKINTSEFDEASSKSAKILLMKSSIDNGMLESNISDKVDVAKRGGEVVNLPLGRKKKRSRGKRKRYKSSCNNITVYHRPTDISEATKYPHVQPSIVTECDSRKHMRFSDSEDNEEVSDSSPKEGNLIQKNKEKEISLNESKSADNRVREMKESSNQGEADIAETVTIGKGETKKYLGPSDGVVSEILRNETNDNVNNKTPHSSSSFLVRKQRKSILNTGLGATLAHLMKNGKTSETCIASTKFPDQKPALKLESSSDPSEPRPSKNYTKFPVMKQFPYKGDMIAFKILKLNDHYEPCISSVIECIVIDCAQDQAAVTIRILDGAKEFDQVNGKFEIQLDEEEEKKTESKDMVLTMDWKDFIEPRILFP